MSFRLQSRKSEAQTLLSPRRLYHQFLVDAYTMVEFERLSFIKRNEKKLRVDKYKNLNETQGSDQSQGSNRGKRVILPSTFVGGRRYMDQLYFNGMAICSSLGFPGLFLTMTCNPNWPEIVRILKPRVEATRSPRYYLKGGFSPERELTRLSEKGSTGRVNSWAILEDSHQSVSISRMERVCGLIHENPKVKMWLKKKMGKVLEVEDE
ncbi:hypothetical protein Lal_00030126 [Lupinus albus]|nr:hypothetical protein Lal_00030126 [Lupinus albus]